MEKGGADEGVIMEGEKERGKQMDGVIGQYFMSDCAACHWARSGVCVHLFILRVSYGKSRMCV